MDYAPVLNGEYSDGEFPWGDSPSYPERPSAIPKTSLSRVKITFPKSSLGVLTSREKDPK
jgi:hypothetical protein